MINITVIPHSDQRYPTVGDWWFDEQGTLQIRVSKMNNTKYEFCVAVHEAIEAFIATSRGITVKEVDDFDIAFENARQEGNFDEPGFDPKCPVYNEHFFATAIEMLIARELKVNWAEYDKTVNSL